MLRVNVKKTKMIISCEDARKIIIEGKFSGTICRKDVGSNSVKNGYASFASVGWIRDLVVLEVN